MRESNFSFPAQNKACVCISSQLYDRRALDTASALPLFNSLTHLTYLTSTSPRIREIMTMDGGLERLVAVLHGFVLVPPAPESASVIYGLSPPSSAKGKARDASAEIVPASFDRAAAHRFSLAFQCLVNIGVRGSEPIRSRVVQAGTLDVVGCILEAWLAQKGFTNPVTAPPGLVSPHVPQPSHHREHESKEQRYARRAARAQLEQLHGSQQRHDASQLRHSDELARALARAHSQHPNTQLQPLPMSRSAAQSFFSPPFGNVRIDAPTAPSWNVVVGSAPTSYPDPSRSHSSSSNLRSTPNSTSSSTSDLPSTSTIHHSSRPHRSDTVRAQPRARSGTVRGATSASPSYSPSSSPSPGPSSVPTSASSHASFRHDETEDSDSSSQAHPPSRQMPPDAESTTDEDMESTLPPRVRERSRTLTVTRPAAMGLGNPDAHIIISSSDNAFDGVSMGVGGDELGLGGGVGVGVGPGAGLGPGVNMGLDPTNDDFAMGAPPGAPGAIPVLVTQGGTLSESENENNETDQEQEGHTPIGSPSGAHSSSQSDDNQEPSRRFMGRDDTDVGYVGRERELAAAAGSSSGMGSWRSHSDTNMSLGNPGPSNDRPLPPVDRTYADDWDSFLQHPQPHGFDEVEETPRAGSVPIPLPNAEGGNSPSGSNGMYMSRAGTIRANAPSAQPGFRGRPRAATGDLPTRTPASVSQSSASASASLEQRQEKEKDGPYRDDDVLLSLQLLAYLSKYPHVRQAFYVRRAGFHPATVAQNLANASASLASANSGLQTGVKRAGKEKALEPEKDKKVGSSLLRALAGGSSSSSTTKNSSSKSSAPQNVYSTPGQPPPPGIAKETNVFALVERFTFRGGGSNGPNGKIEPRMPPEIQYWAGVIMRNACRKDESRGGVRQCANMLCGKWESYPREFAKCRRCRKAKYCGKDCQSLAWSEGHRFWCSAKSEVEDSGTIIAEAPQSHGQFADPPAPGQHERRDRRTLGALGFLAAAAEPAPAPQRRRRPVQLAQYTRDEDEMVLD